MIYRCVERDPSAAIGEALFFNADRARRIDLQIAPKRCGDPRVGFEGRGAHGALEVKVDPQAHESEVRTDVRENVPRLEKVFQRH
jgi:hypothetical protein